MPAEPFTTPSGTGGAMAHRCASENGRIAAMTPGSFRPLAFRSQHLLAFPTNFYGSGSSSDEGLPKHIHARGPDQANIRPSGTNAWASTRSLPAILVTTARLEAKSAADGNGLSTLTDRPAQQHNFNPLLHDGAEVSAASLPKGHVSTSLRATLAQRAQSHSQRGTLRA